MKNDLETAITKLVNEAIRGCLETAISSITADTKTPGAIRVLAPAAAFKPRTQKARRRIRPRTGSSTDLVLRAIRETPGQTWAEIAEKVSMQNASYTDKAIGTSFNRLKACGNIKRVEKHWYMA